MLIEYMHVLSPRDAFKFQRLSELAKGLGTEVRWFRGSDSHDENLAAWREAYALMDRADAFFLPNAEPLYSPEFTQKLHDRVAAGARLLVQADINDIDLMNGFLARYDLTTSRIKIADSGPVFNLGRSPHSFRDEGLLAGVQEVAVQQATAIWSSGESSPVLVASDRQLAINADKDLPSDFCGRELACMAVWRGGNGGAVLVVSAGLFYDPYTGPTGVEWPGVSANERLGTNVIRFLCAKGGPGRAIPSPAEPS